MSFKNIGLRAIFLKGYAILLDNVLNSAKGLYTNLKFISSHFGGLYTRGLYTNLYSISFYQFLHILATRMRKAAF